MKVAEFQKVQRCPSALYTSRTAMRQHADKRVDTCAARFQAIASFVRMLTHGGSVFAGIARWVPEIP
jgi:hypothetical protein